ncbi:Rust resistance kinase Lr10 [Dichanthelium oligosanthes]|uniref:non-specific serine/threonine protein kinase n=1 Tax=Dichanthelium oligosanthes TaxID=888268 RepID=A0A1E5V2I7_9POAL|nr:Rust resistance kinase Lr10 [Dichanthelium oligosanthes]
MTHPGEPALCIEYGTDYFVVSFPSEFGLSYNCPKTVCVPSLIRFFTTVSCSYFHEQLYGTSILNWTRAFFWSEAHFAECAISYYTPNVMFRSVVIAIVSAISITKLHFGKCVEKFLRMQQMLGPIRFAYTDITAITSHFRDKLEEMRMALVYEYMSHGSLDKYIFSAERSFSWDKLNEIALGIARGINYLHLGCDMQILHFDIKPHNILLDSNFVPKVADFGLAKLYPRDNSFVPPHNILAKLYPRDKSFVPTSASRGTVGFIAPEMISRGFGAISSKSDVYSFGLLLLEMAGGRRNFYENAASPSQAYYPSWVYGQLAKQEAGEISSAAIADMHELERKLCIIGLRCIQMNRKFVRA